ncbi:uncharacterized protein LOC111241079 [Vigna radiata var. radiata]|uniref:Uncharacterized protein LOC111241079 n=1 Tax=Vigna radiata var. radiata TaxID=3916 RepID=A0A3Q0EQQ1_VIGRR|nr:uncharacterized protein LOC111241079 [Vigna radiata var. radiata]
MIQESDEESTYTCTWLQDADVILKKTNSEIASLHRQISRLTKEVMNLRQFPMQNKEGRFGEPGEGVGAGDEDVDVGDDDHPLGEEVPAGGDEEATGTHNEAGTSEHRQEFIDVVDEEDDVPEGLVPQVVVPLRSYAGYPSVSDVDVDRLYHAVCNWDNKRRIRVVCEIMGAFLDTNSMRTLAPRKYVDNLVSFMLHLLMVSYVVFLLIEGCAMFYFVGGVICYNDVVVKPEKVEWCSEEANIQFHICGTYEFISYD